MGAEPGTFSRRKESQAPSPRFLEGSRIWSLRRVALVAERDDVVSFRATLDEGTRMTSPIWACHDRPRVRGHMATTGRAVLDVVPDTRSPIRTRSEQRQGGQPRATAFRCGCSRYRGRPPARQRRGRSPSISPLATAPMVRRGGAGGGPEGRGIRTLSDSTCGIGAWLRSHRVSRADNLMASQAFTHGAGRFC